MAGDAPRQIKFTFSVDEASSRNAKRLIEELTRSVEKLVQAAQRAGQSLGGLGTTVGNKPIQAGQGGVTHFAAAGGKSGGIVTSVLGGDASQIQKLSSATDVAFRSATQGVKAFAQTAETDLRRLQRTIEGLTGAMGGLNMGRGGTSGAYQSPFANIGAPQPPQIRNMGFLNGPGFGPGGVNNNFSPFYNGGAVATGAPPPPKGPRAPAGAAGGGFGDAAGLIASRFGLGFLGAGLGTAVGVAGFGLGAYEYGAKAYGNQRLASLAYQTEEPSNAVARQAAALAPFRQGYQQYRAGNVSYALARERALASPAFKAFQDEQRLELERRRAGLAGETLEYGARVLSSGAGGAIARNAPSIGATKGFVTAGARAEYAAPGSSPGERSSMVIQEEILQREQGAKKAAKLQELTAHMMELQGPRFAAIAEGIVPTALSNLQLRRQGLFGVPKDQDPVAYMAVRRAHLAASGWTPEEEGAGRRQILGGAGAGYLSRVGGTTIQSLGLGGFGNATDILRSGGILGGSIGAGIGFLNQANRSMGRGGLDVQVGSSLFGNLAAQALASGQFGAGGAFSQYAGQAAGFVQGGGLDTAEQQRRASLLERGMNGMAGYTQGTKAPLYQMTSLLGGINAAGGYGGASTALGRMRPEVLMAATAGQVPTWAAAQGVTPQMAEKALKYQERAPLLEVVDQLQGGTAADLLKKYRGFSARTGGGFRSFAETETSGLRGAARSRAETKLAEQFGGMAPEGVSPEDFTGTLLAQLVPGGKKLTRGGVGAAGPRGLEKDAATHQAAELNADAKVIADSVKDLSETVKKLFGQSEADNQAVNKLGGRDLPAMSAQGEAGQLAMALKFAALAAEAYAKKAPATTQKVR